MLALSVQKAEAAAKKQDALDARIAAEEDQKWSKGAKTNAKKYASKFMPPSTAKALPAHVSSAIAHSLPSFSHNFMAIPPRVCSDSPDREDVAAKKEDAARKKAEREAQLAEEEAGARSTPKNSKSATKKTTAPSRGTLNLSQLDGTLSTSKGPQHPALNATGIDSALDVLSLASSTATADAGKIDRHPERRHKAAYAAFEARRLAEIEKESPGLRRNQRIEMCRKEFEKSEENPFNQVNARFDTTRDELRGLAEKERERLEGVLAEK